MIKPEQILYYYQAVYELSSEKRFDMQFIHEVRETCAKSGLNIDETIFVQRALIAYILGIPQKTTSDILDLYETWIRKQYYAPDDEEKEFIIAVQNAIYDELEARL